MTTKTPRRPAGMTLSELLGLFRVFEERLGDYDTDNSIAADIRDARATIEALFDERDRLAAHLKKCRNQRRRAVEHAEHFVARAERAEAALRNTKSESDAGLTARWRSREAEAEAAGFHAEASAWRVCAQSLEARNSPPASDDAAVERVARAICVARGDGPSEWLAMHEGERKANRKLARAAIAAMPGGLERNRCIDCSEPVAAVCEVCADLRCESVAMPPREGAREDWEAGARALSFIENAMRCTVKLKRPEEAGAIRHELQFALAELRAAYTRATARQSEPDGANCNAVESVPSIDNLLVVHATELSTEQPK